jgi:hypothetical protein
MRNKNMRIYANRSHYGNTIALHMAIEGPNGDVVSVARPVTIENAVEGYMHEPFMQISNEAAQQLMDELWRCGIRPADGTGSTGQLAATERHLADMRTLAFHALKVPRG